MEILTSGRFWLGFIIGIIAYYGVGKWQQKQAGGN